MVGKLILRKEDSLLLLLLLSNKFVCSSWIRLFLLDYGVRHLLITIHSCNPTLGVEVLVCSYGCGMMMLYCNWRWTVGVGYGEGSLQRRILEKLRARDLSHPILKDFQMIRLDGFVKWVVFVCRLILELLIQ